MATTAAFEVSDSEAAQVPFQRREKSNLMFEGAAPQGLSRQVIGRLAAGSLLIGAVVVGVSIFGSRPSSTVAPLSRHPQQAFEVTSGSANRWAEQPVANLPGIEGAQLSVRMLGADINGTHIVGHLATLANPLERVSLALPPGGCGTRELTTVTARAHRPVCKLAINAGYFNVDNGACIGNVVSHGEIVQTVPLSQGNVNFGVRGGKFFIGYLSPDEIAGFEFLVSGVVWLVRDGKNYVKQGWAEANITVQTSGTKYATNLASRTAVGYDSAGRLIIVQIDGSIAVGHNKRGMDMSMVADVLIRHGAVNAINLDGGGSSTMALNGILINYPSDNRPPSCDASRLYQCERQVSTVLCIHERSTSASDAGAPSGGGASSPLTLAMGGVAILLAGAGFALLMQCLICASNEDESYPKQLSTESTRSVRAVARQRHAAK